MDGSAIIGSSVGGTTRRSRGSRARKPATASISSASRTASANLSFPRGGGKAGPRSFAARQERGCENGGVASQKPRPWEETVDAREYLKSELLRSGVPFEACVAADCRRFANSLRRRENSVEAARLIYGRPDDNIAMREIDQCVSFYEEVSLAGVVGLQVMLQVAIECKARVGLRAFGFRVDDDSHPSSPIIATSPFARAEHVQDAAIKSVADITLPVRALALLVDPQGKGQLKVSEENLIYKGASALLDFVDSDSLGSAPVKADEVLETIGLLDAYRKHIRSGWYPVSMARDWLADRLSEYSDAFAARFHGGREVYHSFSAYCAVMCLDADLFEVGIDNDGAIAEIVPTNVLLTGVRPEGWPHRMRDRAPDVGSEAIIIATNRTGLQLVLARLEAWFKHVVSFLADIDESRAKGVILESAFLNWVARQSPGEDSFYRSDLDF